MNPISRARAVLSKTLTDESEASHIYGEALADLVAHAAALEVAFADASARYDVGYDAGFQDGYTQANQDMNGC